ncbi:MAG: GNAT family N-acetyltransferase [Candidatus Obscuribacterales bacterium]|nr:GNAT family N-acetyltransferase [Candidatus Obscuribacterales bacterium]
MKKAFEIIAGLETERLLLRRWRLSDAIPFATLNADPAVMRYFPRPLSTDESKSFIAGTEAHFEREGFGLWAVELRETGEFIGFVGLSIPRFQAHFTPCVEIGWRLAPVHWGKGYAPEGAIEVLRDAFLRVKLPEVVSFTASSNQKSIRVMEKIGMSHSGVFGHPLVAQDHELFEHVLYRIAPMDIASQRT